LLQGNTAYIHSDLALQLEFAEFYFDQALEFCRGKSISSTGRPPLYA